MSVFGRKVNALDASIHRNTLRKGAKSIFLSLTLVSPTSSLQYINNHYFICNYIFYILLTVPLDVIPVGD
jgi:hypothetical protein